MPQTWRPIDDIETRLLAAVSDDVACDVYGDWLEERGDTDRAEFLRVYKIFRGMRITDPRTVWLSDRLAILRRNVDPAWHVQVERPTAPLHVEVPAPAPPVPAPSPPPPPRRLFPSVVVPPPLVVPNRVPAWISVGSALAASMLVLSFVLYWL